MVDSDIILMVVLVIFVLVVLNLNIVNAKKIRRSQAEAKLKEINENTKVQPADEVENDNYLHDYFSANNGIVMQEVSEKEMKSSKQAVGEVKKINMELPDYDESFEDRYNYTANIVNEMDKENQENDEFEDYKIGIEEDEEDEFKNALSEEFKTLSPEMKAFIMANVLKNKQENPNDDNLF